MTAHNDIHGITRVTVLGTGVLGAQIIYQTAYSGLEVVAYDISDEILDTAKQRLEGLAARYEQEVDGPPAGRRRPRSTASPTPPTSLMRCATPTS